ncbi:nucleotidyltransferase domain-containing protein [Candidatus Omnitrophota bacterium]
MNRILVATNAQKVLDFLIQNPGNQFLAREVQKTIKISKGGVNLSLRKLAKQKLVRREKRGKIFLYSVDHTQPVIKQLKVLKNIELISPLINKIKNLSKKIILFGSCGRGEDDSKSDIDLFVLTNSLKDVEGIVKKTKPGRGLQLITRTPLEFTEMEKKEPIFFEEVSRGITLWEMRE